MGFATDLFTSEPPASCICAVCHDVLKSASSLNCGHTFCEECIKSVVESDPKCPNCRADITDHKPNFVVREIINGLQVRCPDGGIECNWTGRVDALDSHGSTCIYKTIKCDVEGCNHICQRQHMGDHLSDMDVKLRHMELKYDKKLKDMETKYERKFTIIVDRLNETREELNKTRTDCNRLIQAQNRGGNGAGATRRRVRDEGEGTQRNVRARSSGDEFVVEGCGIDAINGIYSRDGENDNVPKYVRRAHYNGIEVEFSLYRCEIVQRGPIIKKWFISIRQPGMSSDTDFYVADASEGSYGIAWSDSPPYEGWEMMLHGIDPPPTVARYVNYSFRSR